MPARVRRRTLPKWQLPDLEQRHLDLIGLGLVALAAFLAFLVYLGGDGGRGGAHLVDGLRWLLGDVHYFVPVALLAAGAILALRPVLPAVRPFRAGGACLFAALTLWLAGAGGGAGWVEAGGGETHGGVGGGTAGLGAAAAPGGGG